MSARYFIVNGAVVVENARHTGVTPGLVLRRGAEGQVQLNTVLSIMRTDVQSIRHKT